MLFLRTIVSQNLIPRNPLSKADTECLVYWTLLLLVCSLHWILTLFFSGNLLHSTHVERGGSISTLMTRLFNIVLMWWARCCDVNINNSKTCLIVRFKTFAACFKCGSFKFVSYIIFCFPRCLRLIISISDVNSLLNQMKICCLRYCIQVFFMWNYIRF